MLEGLNNFLFGTVEENAEREYADYKAGRGRKKDLGDHLGDFLTGRGSRIDRAVEDLHVEKLTDEYGTTIGELNAQPNVKIDPITKDTKRNKLAQQISVATPKAQAYKDMMTQAALAGVTVDPTKITNPEAGYSLIVSEKEKKAKKERDEERGYRRSLVEAAERRADSKEEIARQDRLAREKLARMDNLTLRQDNLRSENRRYELELLRMKQADKQKAQDRRDRMFLTLMNGLKTLGEGFTI